MVDVSIIIVNFNTRELTKECIDSIFNNTHDVQFEVVVVDNSSCDGSQKVLGDDKRIKLICSQVNLGFGKANNLGFKYATGKYLFLLNSDTLLLNNAVKLFFDFMEKSSRDICCCGCMLKDKSLSNTHSFGNFPTFFNCLEEWFFYPVLYRFNKNYKPSKYDSRKVVFNDYCKVDYVTGAALFLRKEICNEFGLFDPDYFLYYEETDMQHRYSMQGFSSVIIDSPKIIHYMEGSTNGQVKKSILSKLRPLASMFLYYRKHNSLISYLFFRFILTILYLPIVFFSPHDNREKIEFIKRILSLRLTKPEN